MIKISLKIGKLDHRTKVIITNNQIINYKQLINNNNLVYQVMMRKLIRDNIYFLNIRVKIPEINNLIDIQQIIY